MNVHSSLSRAAVALACAFGLSGAFAAATAPNVTVTYTDPASFSDAATDRFDLDANLKTLSAYLQQLGERNLATDQTLKITITDIDLAGEARPSMNTGRELRVVRGMADWPRISLSYSLESGDRVVKSGEERLSDMNYAWNLGTQSTSDPLRYEKAMLDDWFKARFGNANR